MRLSLQWYGLSGVCSLLLPAPDVDMERTVLLDAEDLKSRVQDSPGEISAGEKQSGQQRSMDKMGAVRGSSGEKASNHGVDRDRVESTRHLIGE